MPASGDDEITNLVADIVTEKPQSSRNPLANTHLPASKLAPKARATLIKPAVTSLASLAYERGLLPAALDELLTLVTTPSLLDQASLGVLLRGLYPVTRVSGASALRVVGALGHGRLKPSMAIQALLLRWLTMVYHVLEAPGVLSQAYPVLFNLLDTAAIRPQLTHLLALITRRKHVPDGTGGGLETDDKNRLNLSRQTGNDPTLVGLLRVYKDYYPEIIVGEAHPDPAWRERLDELQEAHLQQTQERIARPRDAFRVHKTVGRGQRNKALPSVHTTHATEDSVTLEEIENVQSFVEKIDKLELPNQLVAVLADPLLQKLLLLRPSAESFLRVANWLTSALQDVRDGDADEATLWEIMEVVRDFVVQTKALPSTIINFFASFFQIWSGSGNKTCIFQILAYTPLYDFQAAVADNQSATQLGLLNMYTNLIHHWASVLRSSKTIPAHASRTITNMVQHAGTLALTLLQTSPTLSSESAILTFYEQNLALLTDDTLKNYICIELPPSVLIYLLVFSQSLATVARLCHIMASYKKGFETAMKVRGRTDTATIDASSYTHTDVNRYNGNLLDIVNLHWRMHAFGVDKEVEQGCLLPRAAAARLERYVTSSVDRGFSLAAMLSLSYSPLFCLQSIETLRVLEDRQIAVDAAIETRHAGPVSQESLRKLGTSGGIRIGFNGYRASVLETLRAKGMPGVEELLKVSMPSVAKAIESWAAREA
ncbi:Mis6 domain-containing protein [Cordyceps militaris CM01]|uniref:Mis6 domain-containing protein n=1 Tax=Cordyceps militaris (strain CM01) TaxID=983644 RepID=G3J4R9_CORMM|nr:Mis6 domain-containing protein [Cordyceps militaris CM01]EGX96734.1 Mis6 domain-containing protein [Cordyceps militaris CM01]